MRNRLLLIILIVSFGTIFSTEKQRQNEEIIKDCMRSMYRETWEQTKKTITRAVIEGVSTVDIEEYDTWGYIPLCCALEKNDTEFAKFLLKNGANPNFDLKGVHTKKLIFFTKSSKMIKLLEKYSSPLKGHNTEPSNFK